MKKFAKLMGFDPVAKKTSVKTELIAGLVTFLSMAYILTVNPSAIFEDGVLSPYWSSAFIATALGAVIGTLLMAFVAKMPLAQASGMGLNSLVGSLIAGSAGYAAKFTPGQAFFLVLISGVVFFVLSVIKIGGKSFRELVFDGMPVAVRSAISVGIGLFIAYIGFQNAGVIVANPFTQVELVDLTSWDKSKTAVLALIGLFLIAILDKLNVKGSVIIGILGATIIGIPFGITDLSILAGKSAGISWKFWENIGNFFAGENTVFLSFTSVFKGEGLIPEGISVFSVVMIVMTMCMIDMFDTMGTIVGCCGGNRILSDENDKPRNYSKIMFSDALATGAGAMIGTSTVTTFVESGTGVSAGGRTGLTAFSTATLFSAAIFAMPLFAVIPSCATAAALIYVGVLMMKNNIKSIDFGNAIKATSAFLTIVVMILAYSITKGIGIGILSYTLMSIVAYLIELIKSAIKKEAKPKWDLSVVAIIVSILFCIYFFVPATLF